MAGERVIIALISYTMNKGQVHEITASQGNET